MTNLCHEKGRVVACDEKGHIQVKIDRVDACNTCEAKSACKAIGGQKPAIVIEVENSLGAEVGDWVVVGMPEINVIKASFVVYILPAAGLVVGALAGWEIGGGDGAALMGAVLGLIGGYGGARLWSVRLAKNPAYVPKLVKIASKQQ